MKAGRASPVLAGLTAALLALAGCGHVDSDEPPTAAASVETLAAAFATCEERPELTTEPLDFIGSTTAWLQVTAVFQADRDGDGERKTLPAQVAVFGKSNPVDVLVHSSYWAGVDWALSNKAEVWFALADPAWVGADNLVSFVLIVTPDGRVFFPGECQHDVLYRPLADALGDQLDPTLRRATGLVGSDLTDVLHDEQPQVGPPGPEIVFLNPENVPAETLEAMQFAVVHVTISEPLGPDFTICTKVAAGWNDCFVPEGTGTNISYAIDAYLDGGPLEVWLLDAAADVRNPLALLGQVSIPIDPAAEQEIALRLEIETGGTTGAAIAAAGSEGGVTVRLMEAIPLAELDLSSGDWPGL